MFRQREGIWPENTLHMYLLITSARCGIEPVLEDDTMAHVSISKSLPFVLFQAHLYPRIVFFVGTFPVPEILFCMPVYLYLSLSLCFEL